MTQEKCPHCGSDLTPKTLPITVDLSTNIATVKGVPVQLTAKPAIVLQALIQSAPEFVMTGKLVERLWGNAFMAEPESALRLHVTRLRRTLRDYGVEIDSKQFRGYRLVFT